MWIMRYNTKELPNNIWAPTATKDWGPCEAFRYKIFVGPLSPPEQWTYWVPQKLPQIASICIGKVAWFAVMYETALLLHVVRGDLDGQEKLLYQRHGVKPFQALLMKIKLVGGDVGAGRWTSHREAEDAHSLGHTVWASRALMGVFMFFFCRNRLMLAGTG